MKIKEVSKMKVFSIFTIITMLLTTIAYGESEQVLEKVTLKIEGMTAQCCALIIKGALLKTNGVKKASVSFEDAEAVVEFEADKVTVKQLIKAVKESGYKASIKEMGKKYKMPKETKKEIENKFKELAKKYKIQEEDLEEHWNFVRKEAEQVFERCCKWALSRGMKMKDAESYCKSAILSAIGEYYLFKQIFKQKGAKNE
jgi:mercuric ion binding protein